MKNRVKCRHSGKYLEQLCEKKNWEKNSIVSSENWWIQAYSVIYYNIRIRQCHPLKYNTIYTNHIYFNNIMIEKTESGVQGLIIVLYNTL